METKTKRSRSKFFLDQLKRYAKPMQIVYHGTDEATAKKILRNGFKPGTFFAIHLEDSLGFGGNYIFEVAVESHKISKESDWEFIATDRVLPSQIVELRHYPKAKTITENKALGELVFKSNLPKADLKRILANEAETSLSKIRVESQPSFPRRSSSKVVSGVGYTDKGKARLSRRHHRGWKKIKLT